MPLNMKIDALRERMRQEGKSAIFSLNYPSSSAGSNPRSRPGPVRPDERYDPNREKMAAEQALLERILPLLVDMQQSREKNALEWASGGRELGVRSQESAAERQLRQSLQGQELGFRSREAGLERQHATGLAGQREAGSMDRALLSEAGASERARLGEEGSWARALLSDQGAWDRLAETLAHEDLSRQSGYVHQKDMAALSEEVNRRAGRALPWQAT